MNLLATAGKGRHGQSLERRDHELTILRTMYAIGTCIGDEVGRISDRRLAHLGILALSLINAAPGLNQSDLGTGLNRSSVNVSRMVGELEKIGMVERRPHRQD